MSINPIAAFNFSTYTKVAKTIIATSIVLPLSLLYNLNSAQAQSNFSEIVNIATVNAKIARNPLAPGIQTPRNNSNNSVCLEYVRTGLQAEEAGNESQSLEYYIQALRMDEKCGYAYIFAAELIGKFDKATAIEFGTAGAACFAEEENQEGLEAALELLKSFGVEF
jgi:hypothetical protein